MRREFNGEEYVLVRKYLLSVGVFPDAGRCCVYIHEESESDFVMCLNDETMSICLCLIAGKYSGTNEDILEEILELSKGEYLINQSYIDFYNNDILPVSKFCSEYDTYENDNGVHRVTCI